MLGFYAHVHHSGENWDMVGGDRLLIGKIKFAKMQPSWWWAHILVRRNSIVTLYYGRRVLRSLCLFEFVINFYCAFSSVSPQNITVGCSKSYTR